MSIEINKIYNENCLDTMARMGDGSIDLVVTSPPYDNLRTYEEYEFNFESIAKGLYRVIKKGGVIVWIVDDQTINGSKSGSSFGQALKFKELGLNMHDVMIWKKPTFTDTGSLRVRYGNVFEYMLIFCKGKIEIFNPIRDRKNKTSGQKKSGRIRQADGSLKAKSGIGNITDPMGVRFNVWDIPTVRNKGRGLTQLPSL